MARRLARESTWLGRAVMNGRLHLPGPYPGAVATSRRGRTEQVQGEIVRLHNPEKTFAWLDIYEDCGTKRPDISPFSRDNVAVRAVRGGAKQVWVYLYNRRTWGTRLLPDGYFPAG